MPTALLLHPIRYYTKGLAASLRSFRDIKLSYADTPEEAQKLANDIPDILLTDIDGLFFLPQIYHNLQWSKTRVILIVPEKQRPGQNKHITGAIPIKENAAPKEFYDTIIQAMETEAQRVQLRKSKRNLSRREWEVGVLLSEGNKNGEVAQILRIDQKTVCTYRLRLFEKLKIRSLAQLKERLAELAAAE